MDLTVRKSHCFCPLTLQISQTHCDHSRLLFLYIDKLNQASLAASLKVPSCLLASFIFAYASCATCKILVKHHLNVPLPDLQLIVLNNVEWSLHTTSICAELDLTLCEVPHN